MREPDKKKLVRVLCVFGALDRGGAETMCMNLYRNIDRDKVQFDFVKHTKRTCAFDEEIIQLGGRIFTAPQYKIYNHFEYIRWWKAFFSQHTEYKIVHGHYFTISAVYFAVARKFGIKTIGHSHSTGSDSKSLETSICRFYEKMVERYSDYCIACSNASGLWLFPNKDFLVLRNAIDPSRFLYSPETTKIVRKELGISDSTLVLGNVGNFSYAKNPIGVINVLKAVSEKHPDVCLIMVGDGALHLDAINYAEKVGLKDKIIFTGVRSDVSEIYQAMDAFVFPSFFEGLPVAVIEAQASGIQCFISERVSKECDITGRCSFLPIDEVNVWTDTILSADLVKMDTRQQICEAGYDIQKTSNWLQEFYIGLLSE